MIFRRFSALAYGAVALAVILIAAFVAGPLFQNVVERWFQHDVEARSRLAFVVTRKSIRTAIENGDFAHVNSIFDSIALDDRIMAAGLCDGNQRPAASSKLMPESFSCQDVARSKAESFSRADIDGIPVMVAAFPLRDQGPEQIVLLTDLSFIDARSNRAVTYLIAIVASTSFVLILFAAASTVIAARTWMRSLGRALDRLQGAEAAIGTGAKSSPLEAKIHKLLREHEGLPNTVGKTDWTPQTLQDLIRNALPGADLIVVSNREPYIHNLQDGKISLQRPASGLVSALEPIMQTCGGIWIAHGSGSADRQTVDKHDRIAVPVESPSYSLRRVWISDEEQEGYYYGFANEGLWPLCHIAFVKPKFRAEDWKTYRQINERFADAVAAEAKTPDPIVLVHDYHFALAPKMIRDRLPQATIVLFWHIPWPNAETFGICPWKEELIRGMLGSSIIGFHTQFHCNNFVECVDRFVESRIDREFVTVALGGNECRIRPYPISIEWPPAALASVPSVKVCREDVCKELSIPSSAKIAVAVERFDYTKGILDRMMAIDVLLRENPALRNGFVFIQVAAPTRSKLDSYTELQVEAQKLADAINERHGNSEWSPIRLLVRHHEPDEVFKLFRAADVCLVSSLHDGMNLVAKEFIAARDDCAGVLVLSSFAGASRELAEALIVNPYDPAAVSAAILRALSMPLQQQIERMKMMREQIRENNVHRWAGNMLLDSAKVRKQQRIEMLAMSSAD